MQHRSVRISDKAIVQEVSGETVILDLNSEQYFSLDSVATRIWKLLQQTKDLDEVFRLMLNEYEVDEQQLNDDLESLIDALLEEGLISACDEYSDEA